MANLIYSVLMSLDGYVSDEEGNFGWATPDEEVHSFVNGLEREVGTHLYGRKMYETMLYWEAPDLSAEPQAVRDYAEIWQAARKVVFSRTLKAPLSRNTSIEAAFRKADIEALKASAGQPLSVGGPEIASHAFAEGLVDEVLLFVCPVVVGGGHRALPANVSLGLELVAERRFESGVVFLQYRVSR